MWVEKVFVKPFENHIDIIQETNVKERILIVKKNSNVVNNTLQESEYTEIIWWTVDEIVSVSDFTESSIIRNFSYLWLLV